MAAEQSGDVDSLLRTIARDIPHNEAIEDLGSALGFSVAEIQNFIRTNSRYHEITSDGTVFMLRKWSERVSPLSLRSALREALMRARLVRIAETHLPLDSSLARISEEKPPALTCDEVQLLKKDLQGLYQRMYTNVRTSPLKWQSSMKLKDIYTNLVMVSVGMLGEKKAMSYDAFIKDLEGIGSDGGLYTRITILGEAGVGKTTFLAKLALDWASGRCLKMIDLLFLIHLREIEKSTYFADTIVNNVSDELSLNRLRLDEYIRMNQKKVLILYDGLDEYSQDIRQNTSNDATIAVLRGEKFKRSPVIVTTRPWKGELIRSDAKLEHQYTVFEIEGFKKDDVTSYISKFFSSNVAARDSLISFLTGNNLVAQNMVPYPIYCSMLCHIWQDEGSRTVIQGLKTFAQLFEELIHCLNDHYAGKETNHESKSKRLQQGQDCFRRVGKHALYCLLENQLVFGEENLEKSKGDLETACEIGVLTREEWFVSRRENNTRETKRVVEYRFPHKLFQEYLAGVYMASLFQNDRKEFNMLNNQLMMDYKGFRYLFYFTAAQGLDVGKAVLGSLCEKVTSGIYDDLDFIVDVAFECHKIEALEPLIPCLNKLSILEIRGSGHTTSGWLFAAEACGHFAANCSDHSSMANREDSSDSAAKTAGQGICSLSNLTSLYLRKTQLHDDFYAGMASLASQSKLQNLVMEYKGVTSPVGCQNFAQSICTMPCLDYLKLECVAMAPEFYIKLEYSSSHCQLQMLRHKDGAPLGPAASQAFGKSVCTMPRLQKLSLTRVGLTDEFFIALQESSPKSQLLDIHHHSDASVCWDAAFAYGRSICTMPKLQNVLLFGMHLDNDFYRAMEEFSSTSWVQSYTHNVGKVKSSAASRAYAKTVCTMPRLQELRLGIEIHDAFFDTLAHFSVRSQLQWLCIDMDAALGRAASCAYAQSVCSMPNLEKLRLRRPMLTDEFYLTLEKLSTGCQVQSIAHSNDHTISAAASQAYAKSVCSMPNLQALTLYRVNIADIFYATLAASSSGAKIRKLHLVRVKMSDRILQSILCLPCLSSLTVREVQTEEFRRDESSVLSRLRWLFTPLGVASSVQTEMKTEAGKGHNQEGSESDFKRSPVVHLGVDVRSLHLLKQLKVTSLCPNVEKVTLFLFRELEISFPDLKQAWPLYSHSVELSLPGDVHQFMECQQLRQALLAPQNVIKLSVRDTHLGNERAKELIRSVCSYSHLKNIMLIRCSTTEDLDPFCEEVNKEGRLGVAVEHGNEKSED